MYPVPNLEFFSVLRKVDLAVSYGSASWFIWGVMQFVEILHIGAGVG